jgi:hypothetical protein
MTMPLDTAKKHLQANAPCDFFRVAGVTLAQVQGISNNQGVMRAHYPSTVSSSSSHAALPPC